MTYYLDANGHGIYSKYNFEQINKYCNRCKDIVAFRKRGT